MDQNKEKSIRGKKALVILCRAALTVIGFTIIPPLINKYANKVYKASLNKEDIDFDDMGPEIVPNKETEE